MITYYNIHFIILVNRKKVTSKVKVFCLNDGKLNDQLRAYMSIIQGETNSDRCTKIIIVKIT